mmetsp:Transcript_143608/g.459408  ORF Transcript_143608/g.459408 Transcript_143608/m.459408 type:complete len:260 (-) Transcript_143608:1367-2146(-)
MQPLPRKRPDGQEEWDEPVEPIPATCQEPGRRPNCERRVHQRVHCSARGAAPFEHACEGWRLRTQKLHADERRKAGGLFRGVVRGHRRGRLRRRAHRQGQAHGEEVRCKVHPEERIRRDQAVEGGDRDHAHPRPPQHHQVHRELRGCALHLHLSGVVRGWGALRTDLQGGPLQRADRCPVREADAACHQLPASELHHAPRSEARELVVGYEGRCRKGTAETHRFRHQQALPARGVCEDEGGHSELRRAGGADGQVRREV